MTMAASPNIVTGSGAAVLVGAVLVFGGTPIAALLLIALLAILVLVLTGGPPR